jgi:RimJ/RimL family protein N-acetyltransferase
MTARSQVAWSRQDGVWRAFEPTPEELATFAPLLADAYNEPYNRAMMANGQDLSAEDVTQLWQDMRRDGGRPFLLFRGDEWIGDADFRHVEGGRAEFAIMVGPRGRQGKGVGTAFAVMLHGLAFRVWGLDRVYVTILPANVASQRLFGKLGYQLDNSAQARSYADADDDVSMSCGYEQLAVAHGATLDELAFSELP